jgi:hypothetical protein
MKMKSLIRSIFVAMPVASVVAASASTLRGSSQLSSSSIGNDEIILNGPQHLETGVTGSDFVGMNQHMANIWDPWDRKQDTAVLFTAQDDENSTNTMSILLGDFITSCLDLNALTLTLRTPEEIAQHAADHAHDDEDYDYLGGAVLVTPFLHHVSEQILSNQHRGRIFTLMEDPVQYAIRRFSEETQRIRQQAAQEKDEEQESQEMSLFEFLLNANELYVDNSMTRQLVGKASSAVKLTLVDLEDAKSILRYKIIVGLCDDEYYQESIQRFSLYFGWEFVDSNCLDTFFVAHQHQAQDDGMNNKTNSGLLVFEATEMEMERLTEVEQYDVALFHFAVDLFKQQALLFEDEHDSDYDADSPLTLEVI